MKKYSWHVYMFRTMRAIKVHPVGISREKEQQCLTNEITYDHRITAIRRELGVGTWSVQRNESMKVHENYLASLDRL